MKVLIFKTDIQTTRKLKLVEPLLNPHPLIDRWSVDTEDIDNVLRVETLEEVNAGDIIRLIRSCGFFCEELAG